MPPSKSKIFKRERTRWLISLRRYGTKLTRDLTQIFTTETQYTQDHYENDIAVNGFSIVREMGLKRDIEDAIVKNIRPVIRYAVRTVNEQVSAELKEDFSFEGYLLEYIASGVFEESMALVVANYYGDLRSIIQDGIEKDMTRAEIAESLQRELDFTKTRAERIARTETHSAMMFASEKRARAIQDDLDMPMLKQWIPAEDGRTRSAHSAMANSDPIPVDQMFTVGGEKMSRPGDPRASAANKINCRCVLRYIPQ